MAKKRKFRRGGTTTVDAPSTTGVLSGVTSERRDTPEISVEPTLSKSASRQDMSFGRAFRDARNSGDKTFMWRGRSYGTELAGERKPAPAPARRATPTPAPAAARRATPTPAPAAARRATPTPASRPASSNGALLLRRQRQERPPEGTPGRMLFRAKGGSVSSRGDGIAKRGKTKGKIT